MADTPRGLTALQSLLADNITGDIGAQDVRDFLVSVYGRWRSKSIVNGDSPYAIGNDDVTIAANATAGAISITLPTGSDHDDRSLFIKKTDSSANAITINRAGADTIEGQTSYTLSRQYSGVLLVKVSTLWMAIGVKTPMTQAPMLMMFGKSSNSVSDQYLNAQHTIASNETGYRMIRAGEVTGVSWQIKAGTTASGDGTIYIRKNLGNLIAVSVTNGDSGAQDGTVSGVFAAGDLLSAYVDSTSLALPIVIVEMIWR